MKKSLAAKELENYSLESIGVISIVVTGESYVWKFDNAFCGGNKVPERAFGPEAMNATFDELTTTTSTTTTNSI